MNIFDHITESPETLAAFLCRLSAIETPWGEAFHRQFCDACAKDGCDDCLRPERANPLWWLNLPVAAEK